MRLLVLASCISSAIGGGGWIYDRDRPDLWTRGEVWPMPHHIEYGRVNRSVSPGRMFIAAGTHEDCDIVQDNVRGYVERWFFPFPVKADLTRSPYHLTVRVYGDCPLGAPQQGMNESYVLKVSSEKAVLEAPEVWGAVRGLETFSQLIYFDEDDKTYKLRTAVVHDEPRFSYRGLLIDTSRHFLSVKTIKRQIDVMAANKLNVLHWHIVDSESFPYQSIRFPHLSKEGAYSPRHVYTRAMVQDIIEHARTRAVRVVPEFDTPGHTSSWKAQPGFLTECYDEKGVQTNTPNLIDPSNEENFKFLADFFEEIVSTFPEEMLHLGGDEVWHYVQEDRNPKIRRFMSERGFNTTTELTTFYFSRLMEIINGLHEPREHIFWNEVFNNNKPMESSIIHIWEGNTTSNVSDAVARVTAKGHRVILSSCWYLNYVKYGADWKDAITPSASELRSRYYYCDPHDFVGTRKQKDLVLGGVATMWGEFVDNTNIEDVLWPRASAVAERLWSRRETTNDASAAWPRMHEFRCRMVSRGYRFAPTNWPDFCNYEFED